MIDPWTRVSRATILHACYGEYCIGLVGCRRRRARAYAHFTLSISNAHHHTRAKHASLRSPRFANSASLFFVARASVVLNQYIDQLSRFAPAVLSDIELRAFRSVTLDLRRPGFQHSAHCLSIPTAQSDLDVSINLHRRVRADYSGQALTVVLCSDTPVE